MIDYIYLDKLINDCEIAKQSKPIRTYIYSSNDDLETFFDFYRAGLTQKIHLQFISLKKSTVIQNKLVLNLNNLKLIKK